ncbi:MAG: hypothetical protein KDJ97_13885 [Anaerolineae bacterium]|nr:hypothetical protein [Anaerolineae bacterium]
MTSPIILSKIQPPPTRPDLIIRPQLLEWLQTGISRRLTLVSAPAGFGKTTLISSWLDTLEQSKASPAIAWVSLDEGDNAPVRFWTYTLAALHTVQPEVGQTAQELLNGSELPSFEIILTALLNDIQARLPTIQRIILIFDDYHIIEDQTIHEWVTFLLEHLPPQLHLVIISRSDPPLPIARLRARNQLTELRTDDLRFTPAEAAAFLNQAMGLQLSAENISALEARTEGWIAGLQLAALSLQGREDIEGFIANFTGSHQYVLDYLVQEVFEQQPQTVQRFLLQTSILDQLSGPLCDAVTGDHNGQSMLEHLAAVNLFVRSLDDRRQWYRYHRLFLDLLRHKLQQTGIDVDELNRRASHWYEQEGSTDQAIHYALAAHDYDHAGDLIVQNIKDIFIQGKKALLLTWLEMMPPSWLHAHPLVCLAYAWVLFVNGKFEASKQRLAQVETQLMTDGAEGEFDEACIPQLQALPHSLLSVKGLLLTLKGQLSVMQGETQQGIDYLEAGLSGMPDEPPGLKNFVIHQLRLAYWINGDFDAAENILHRFQTEQPVAGDTATIIALLNQAERHLLHGRLQQAAVLYQRLLQVLNKQEREAWFPAALAHSDLGVIFYEWNDLAGAEYHARKGIEFGNRGLGTVRAVAAGYFGLIQTLRAQNKLAEASRVANEMDGLLQEVDLGFHLPISNVLRIPLWIAQNDLDTIRQLLPTYQTAALSRLASQVSKLTSLVAQRYLALNEIDEVAVIASNLLVADDQNIDDHVNGRVLLALVHQAQGDRPQALIDLTEALALAEPEGYIRTFVDFGPPMIALLHDVLAASRQNGADQPPTADYIHTLLKTAQPLDAPPPNAPLLSAAASPLLEPLTDREMDVLQLLAKGYSNRKIADELVITPGTVKIHTSHIYSKLDVSNRTQAVAKARELAILLTT